MKKITTFHEYKGFVRDGKYVKDPSGVFSRKDLEYLSYLSENLVPNSRIFDIGLSSITARNYVGVISFGGHQIEILPKLLGSATNKSSIIENLTHMLSYVNKLPVFDNELGNLSSSSMDFLDIYIKIFAQKLSISLRKGVPRRYITEEDNLSCIKGKIKIKENIKRNHIQKNKVYCEYDSFSENNILNKAFLSVIHMLLPIVRDESAKVKLKHCLRFLADVDHEDICYHQVKNYQLSRANGHISEVFEMAKFFLKGLRQELSVGSEKVFSIIFDMNELFEEFVYRFMQDNQKSLRIASVSFQKKRRLISGVTDLMTSETEKRSLMDTYLDIFVEMEDGRKIIIDTKYKLLNEDGSYHYNVKNSDVYQMCTYQRLYGLDTEPEVLLLYPKNKETICKALSLNGKLKQVTIANVDLHEKMVGTSLNNLLGELKLILNNLLVNEMSVEAEKVG